MKRKISSDGLQSAEDPGDDDDCSQNTPSSKRDEASVTIGSSGIAGLDEDSPDIANYTYFPRLFKLRQDHNIKQEIVCHLSKLHHITKDHKGFYRVRICRTCSGLPHLLELGSYSDLESATLVNDVHEFLNNRTRHLHVITEDDIRYIDQISVTRTWRHERSEVKLLELLQERLDKSKSNQSKTSVHYSNPYIYGQGLMGMPPGMPPPSQPAMGMWPSYPGQVPPPHMMGPPQQQQQQQQQHYADAGMMAANGNAYMMQRLQAQKGLGGNPMSQQQPQQMAGGGNMMGSSTHQQGPSQSMYSQGGHGGNVFNNNTSNANNSDSIQSAMDDNYDTKSARVSNVNVDTELKALSRSQQEDAASSQQHAGSSSSGSGSDLGGLHSLLGAAQSLMPPSSGSSSSSGGLGLSSGGGSGPSASTPWGSQSQLQYHQQQQQHQQSNAAQQQQHSFNSMMSQHPQQGAGMAGSMYGGGGGHPGMMGGAMGSQGQQNPYMQQQHPGQGMPGAYGMWGAPQHPHSSGPMGMMAPPAQPAHSPNMFQQHQQFLMQQQTQQQQQSQNQGGRSMFPNSMHQSQQQQQQTMSSLAASYAQQQHQQSGVHSQMSPRGVPSMASNRGNNYFGGSQMGASSSFDPSNPSGSISAHGSLNQLQQQMPIATPPPLDAPNAWSGANLGSVGASASTIRSSKNDQNPPLELSEETIQRVTLMTYEFEGAKNFLFQKLNCACAVENSSYFVNLALDSLIALFVAPSYSNPMYTQNAIRAIEYVMSSGCITSASLYLLAVAYTPGGYETSTMMLRNLHSAMKMYERKFEQQACSSRRMSFYSSKVIQYMKSSNISKAKVLDAAKPKIEATGKLAQLEDADAANSSTSSSIARASNVLCAVQNGPFPTVPSGSGASSNVPYKSCTVVTMPASMAEWEAYFSKILRCNHTIALKCDLNVRMPVWWPNSFQPFGQTSTMSSNISNFLHFECIIRGEFATSQFHYKIISNLVDAFVEAGYESHIVSLNRSEKDRLASSPPPQGLGEPEDLPVFACTTNLLMLSSYGTCTVMMRSLELLADMNVLPTSDCSPDVDKEGRQDNGMSRVLDSCIVEFCRWKKYFDERISDPAVIGMYQSIFMDLLILLLGSKKPEPDAAAEDASAPRPVSIDAANGSASDTNGAVSLDASASLLGQPTVNPSASIAAASVAAGVVAEGEVVTAGGSNAEGGGFISSRFKTLLDVIADVAPLPVESSKDQRTSIDLSKFSAKSLTRTNIYAILRELVRDTQLSGIAGTAFQHPLRADNNKFAPHFTVAHEISLRINMSCLSILGEVSVNEDHCLTESSICSSIRGLLNPEAAILGVYREMLFLGEWMDASEGGCPLFSHTYMAFWLCLKACRKLVPKYPNFADVLNKILVLIPRILKSCSRRNGLCTVLLEFEEEEGFGLTEASASAASAAPEPPSAAPVPVASSAPIGGPDAATTSGATFSAPGVNRNVNMNEGEGASSGSALRASVFAAENTMLPVVDAFRP